MVRAVPALFQAHQWPGLDLQLIGYGETQDQLGDSGIKRSTENTVAALTLNQLTVIGNSNVCPGDSGGPALATIDGTEVQVGVNVAGLCGVEGVSNRVDVYAPWITTASQGDAIYPPPLTDTTPPTTTIIDPKTGSQVSSSLAVEVVASDTGSGVAAINLYLDGTHESTAFASPAVFQLSGLGFGGHSIVATTHDASGNSASDAIVVTVSSGGDLPPVVDTTPPKVAITEPADGAVVGGTFVVKVQASDDESGLSSVALHVDGWPEGVSAGSASFEVTGVVDGVSSVEAIAHDRSGNSATATISVTVDASSPGGCDLSGGSDLPQPLVLLLLALVVITQARRSARSARSTRHSAQGQGDQQLASGVDRALDPDATADGDSWAEL